MKICGFTFVRNAVKIDSPVVPSITSVLPIVDEFIVSVGKSNDGTLELIESIGSPKIKIFHSAWDETIKEGGRVLAVETDKALAHVPTLYDWAFYLQADEVVHEKDLPAIVQAVKEYTDDKRVEGLLFNYIHFYGTYDYYGDSRRWYNHEIRIIRNNGNFCSFRDAQGFRTRQNRKLAVKKNNASIYHYGWVRHPHKQLEKLEGFYALWNGPDYVPPVISSQAEFDFLKDADSLAAFKGTHPAVMKGRIVQRNWQVNINVSKKRFSPAPYLIYLLDKWTGIRLFTSRNYRII
ncbi:MAG: glycosyltransferase family 2 protein [Bacteroidetes bacterium]|nr:glycosyltransferase family 2 protein [Bacteroidota bacterium]